MKFSYFISYFNLFKNNRLIQYRRHAINQKRMLSLGIIGAPTSVGQPKPGVELGPDAIRSTDLLKQIKNLGHDVIDFGDFNLESLEYNNNNFNLKTTDIKLKNEILVRQMYQQLSQLVLKVIKTNRIPITIGGDHSIAIASVVTNGSQHENEDMCVLWIDAHADINTVESTNTGNFHGMPVSFMIKQIQQIFNNPNKNCLPVKACIDANNLAFIGIRDIEFCELDIIRKTNITHFTPKDIDKLGINEVIARSLDKINPKLKRKIHVSFDIDALDPIWAPSTGTTAPGGLTLREGLCIGENIFATNMLCGLDLVEVNPTIGDQNDVKKTINSAVNIILSFLGKTRIGEHYI